MRQCLVTLVTSTYSNLFWENQMVKCHFEKKKRKNLSVGLCVGNVDTLEVGEAYGHVSHKQLRSLLCRGKLA